jgi:enoyl-CoA hydratase
MPVESIRNGTITTVVLSRPEARNAVDPVTAIALHAAFLAFEADAEAKVAVFWGAGGAFCAGYDLKAAAGLAGAGEPLSALDFPADRSAPLPRGPMGPTRLELAKPVIAAVEGPAVAGGMELALWCDLRVVAEGGYFGVYCRRWGVPLIDGGTVRLPRLVGEGRALDLILTGRKVEAEEALRIGLADRLVKRGEARAAAEALAAEIARFPQACMKADRRSARAQHGLPMRDALAQEWRNAAGVLAAEGIAGAGRFAAGKGRGGDFGEI